MKKKRKNLIVVLGMHRSGTSVITRGLKVLGAQLGSRLMPPAEDNNLKGFWEDLDINALNKEMLSTVQSYWHFVVPIQQNEVDILRNAGYLKRAVDLLAKKTLEAETFAIKDPRMAKLMPFWKEVFDESQLNVLYVLSVRHPISVCQSLARRNNFSFEKSSLLWLEHILSCLITTVNKERILVDYDLFLHSPGKELERIARRFGFRIDREALDEFITEYIDLNLRHSIYNTADLVSEKTIAELAKDVFIELRKVAKDQISLENHTFVNKISTWNDEFLRQYTSLTLVDKFSSTLDKRLEVLENEMAEYHQRVQFNFIESEKRLYIILDNLNRFGIVLKYLWQRIKIFGRTKNKYLLLPVPRIFWREWYFDENPDTNLNKIDAYVHFITIGWKEGRNPNPFFDCQYYLEQNPDILALGIDPLNHYLSYGWKENRNPGPFFDVSWYRTEYSDVSKLDIEPLEHYLRFGWMESRAPMKDFSALEFFEYYSNLKNENHSRFMNNLLLLKLRELISSK